MGVVALSGISACASHNTNEIDRPAAYSEMEMCKVGNLRALRWIYKPVGIMEKLSKSGIALYQY